ncbi:MAG: acyl-CoA dehydrogenase [Hyphomicrobiales bacterium]|nr:acyl-CoA dehydrogenase [Hyphomicrobiales bacterium]
MKKYLTEDRRSSIELVRQSAKAITGPAGDLQRVRDCRFKAPGYDRKIWAGIGALGWPGLLVAEENGGSGLGMAELCALVEELGRGLVPEPVAAAAIAAPYLPSGQLETVLAGQGIVLPALIETVTGDGAPATSLADGKLNGTKRFVIGATGADGFLVDTASGLAFVKADTSGVSIRTIPTRDGGEVGTVTFSEAAASLVKGEVGTLRERLWLAQSAYLFGAMSRLFEITLEYLSTRKQFGTYIGSFQALQHRAVDLKIQISVSRAVLDDAIAAVEDGENDAFRGATISRATARVARAAMKIVQECVQMHGAIGVTDEYDAGLFVRKILTLVNHGGRPEDHLKRYFDLALRDGSGDADKAPAAGAVSTENLPDDYNQWDDEIFRLHIRQWVEANYPAELRYPTHRLHRLQTKIWYDLLSHKGWLAPAWPREYGGMGLGAAKRLIMIEEFERHGCSRYSDQGVLMIGPLLMQFGTEQQRQFFLPKIITGEHIWAQGYSEPGSGSDLASLRTSAKLEGDNWIVNGQKIWTTLAQDCNWIYVLVRTDPNAKKQQGISFLLMPLDTPGITVRPIRTLGMTEEFCEVFFDNVRVPKDAMVGELNKGWQMAKALLGFERIFVGAPAQSRNALNRLGLLVEQLGIADREDVRARRAELAADLADHAALYESFADKLRKGEVIGPEVSMLKINQTELFKSICASAISLAGQYAGMAGPIEELDGLDPSGLWIQSLQSTIYGGTSEIQRNILAKNVLGMPG